MNTAQQLVDFLHDKKWQIRCVESCTAGALTASLGEIAGVSSVLERSWVTYSNQAKMEEVGVPLALLESYGAVSKEVVIAMAEGAVVGCEDHTLAIAISGIAGPGGGTIEKPLGTVWIALKMPHQSAQAQCFQCHGSRKEIQTLAVQHALAMPLTS